MLTSLWLAWKELTARPGAFAVGVAIVASAVGLTVALDLLAHGRLAAVGGELDHMGPSLLVLPAGRTPADRARMQQGGGKMHATLVDSIRAELGPKARAVEGRWVASEAVDDTVAPVIRSAFGQPAGSAHDTASRHGAVVDLGPALAEKLGKSAGASATISNVVSRIREVRRSTGTAEDAAVFVDDHPLEINEVLVFLRPGQDAKGVASSLVWRHPDLTVLPMTRGDDNEGEIVGELERQRWPLYLLTSLVLAMCTLAWSYVSAVERRLEMATLATLGVSASGLVLTLAARAAIVGLIGAVGGVVAAGAVVVMVDSSQIGLMASRWTDWPVVIVGAMVVSALGALPVSALCRDREWFFVLQNQDH